MKSFITTVLAFALTAIASTAYADVCQVQTFNKAGEFIAQVKGEPMTCAQASQVARVLNVRHNNGSNPIEAKFFLAEAPGGNDGLSTLAQLSRLWP